MYDGSVPLALHAVGVNMEPVKADNVISSKKGTHLIVIKGFKFHSQNILSENM
jgi:hypothetical protein